MNKRLERRLRSYLEGRISLRRFYNWYMRWHAWVEDGGIVSHPEEDTRVTLVLYEYTSEPIRSMPDREDWLKKELADVLKNTGRWSEPVATTPCQEK